MRFTCTRYPQLRVHGVVKFVDGVAEVSDPAHVDALTAIAERYGIEPAEPVKPKTRRKRRTDSQADQADGDE